MVKQHAMNTTPRLSLGPILYYWSRDQVLDFYRQVADWPVDIVYLGETVCSKRNLVRTDDWLQVAGHLVESGKQVVLSTLALLEAESELKRLRRICGNERFLVEANDMGAVNLLRGQPFVAGHSVNIYNGRTLSLLARQGLQRWVLPIELSGEAFSEIREECQEAVDGEVFAYGRLPLAYSARCFTARAHKLPKDDCQYRCLDYPDGLTLAAQDDTRFLALNGIQTQSAQTVNLLGELPDLLARGVAVLRISPQSQRTDAVVATFRRCLDGELTPQQGAEKLEALMPVGGCNGYWHGDAGMLSVSGAARELIG